MKSEGIPAAASPKARALLPYRAEGYRPSRRQENDPSSPPSCGSTHSLLFSLSSDPFKIVTLDSGLAYRSFQIGQTPRSSRLTAVHGVHYREGSGRLDATMCWVASLTSCPGSHYPSITSHPTTQDGMHLLGWAAMVARSNPSPPFWSVSKFSYRCIANVLDAI